MSRSPSRLLASAVALVALALAGCAASDDGSSGSASASDASGSASESEDAAASAAGSASEADAPGAFPVTIEHAFGQTEIPDEPQRVVALGWGSPEAVLALGVVPVAVEAQVWTVGEGNQLPWVAEEVAELGGEEPVILPNDFTTPAYEQIIALEPDLILAHYSGYGEEQYELLSDIAPTVAYPETAWTTPWRDVIEITADAMGRAEAGEQVLADLEAYFAETAAAHPELEGVTVANVWDGDGVVSVYTAADPRVAMMTDLGFEIAPAVDQDTDLEGVPAYELSYEELDKLEADLLVSYHSTQDDADAFLDKPEMQAIPAVAAGRVAQVVGNEYISAVSPPNALSIEWGMQALIDALTTALAE